MDLSVTCCYTSVACGRTPHCLDWNSNGVICYGASNVVVIYDTTIRGQDQITAILHAHKKQVNAVKWIQNGSKHSEELISCSGDKTAAVWTRTQSEQSDKWNSTELKGHTDGVTCCDGLYLGESSSGFKPLLVFTSSIDSTIRVWLRDVNGTVNCKHTISLGSGLCLSLRATVLPGTNKPVLIAALDDDRICLFTEDECGEFHKATTLTGHEDWVRGLDVITTDSNSLLLASSSQDTYVRLWSITRCLDEEDSKEGAIRVEKKLFEAYRERWSTKLEAVLAGHEGWVYGVHWHPMMVNPDGTTSPVYRLLSSSIDKTVIVWSPQGEGAWSQEGGEGVWSEGVRVGEVGGNGLGFYGARWGPRGESFIAHGYNGSFHMWSRDESTKQWTPSVVCGGHFKPVHDVRWEPQHGRYIMSVSADQTTRVHAPWLTDNVQWHEVARPQIHGFDMSSLALISGTRFVSAAEEKVIRVFQAPHNFVQNFKNITGMELAAEDDCAEGASVPSLGLSNKAVFGQSQENGAEDCDTHYVPTVLTAPPTEETLMQNTLWPETRKLYGHGYEVFALDVSRDGRLLASACHAAQAEHAAVLIWDTTEWRQLQKLIYHKLTVTQLAFAPDDRHLLSVSRDRYWALFQRDGAAFRLVAASDKSNGEHTRMIWCCAWTHDALNFATGSREGKICVWSDVGNTNKSSLGAYGLLGDCEVKGESVTALAFAPADLAGQKMLAVGAESGLVRIYLLDFNFLQLIKTLDNSAAHHLTVNRLSFRPRSGRAGGEDDPDTLQLASCGNDNTVRVYTLTVRGVR